MRRFFLVVEFWKKMQIGGRGLTKVTERFRFRNSREQNKQEYIRQIHHSIHDCLLPAKIRRGVPRERFSSLFIILA